MWKSYKKNEILARNDRSGFFHDCLCISPFLFFIVKNTLYLCVMWMYILTWFFCVFHNLCWVNLSLLLPEKTLFTQSNHSSHSFSLSPMLPPFCVQLPPVSCSSVKKPASAGWFWGSRVPISFCPSMSWGTSELLATTRWIALCTGWMDGRTFAGPGTMALWWIKYSHMSHVKTDTPNSNPNPTPNYLGSRIKDQKNNEQVLWSWLHPGLDVLV